MKIFPVRTRIPYASRASLVLLLLFSACGVRPNKAVEKKILKGLGASVGAVSDFHFVDSPQRGVVGYEFHSPDGKDGYGTYDGKQISFQLDDHSAGRTGLHVAVVRRNLPSARRRVGEGAEINARDEDGWTPLSLAALGGSEEMFVFLLQAGADPTARARDPEWSPDSGKGPSLLWAAAVGGDVKIVERLLADSPQLSVNDGGDDNKTPLHGAAESGSMEIASLFIARGADINAKANSSAEDADRPLHVALKRGRKAVAELLIAKGADVNARNAHGETPLYLACQSGLLETARQLAAKGADVNATTSRHSGLTLFEWAIDQQNIEIVAALIDLGAPVDGAAADDWPLFWAASNDRLDIFKLLLARGANPNRIDSAGNTLLHIASNANRTEIVKHLIEMKADVNAVNHGGETPLWQAAEHPEGTKTAEWLLAAGADANPRPGSNSWSILHTASPACAELLLRHGSRVDARAEDGLTPLILAAQHGLTENVRVLIDGGAHLNASESNGWTALHYAATNGELEVAELLIARGADIKAKDKRGRTALQVALDGPREGRMVHEELVRLLRSQETK